MKRQTRKERRKAQQDQKKNPIVKTLQCLAYIVSILRNTIEFFSG
ncbi:hypothetical protein [Gracilibacillus sp. YIM 98692]|nr:hypothetical protein [Gracilibacillus sp. YIM 98692]